MTPMYSVPLTRILSEDVGEFDLFVPGMGYQRAQARKGRARVFAACAALALSLLTACRQLLGHIAA